MQARTPRSGFVQLLALFLRYGSAVWQSWPTLLVCTEPGGRGPTRQRERPVPSRARAAALGGWGAAPGLARLRAGCAPTGAPAWPGGTVQVAASPTRSSPRSVRTLYCMKVPVTAQQPRQEAAALAASRADVLGSLPAHAEQGH